MSKQEEISVSASSVKESVTARIEGLISAITSEINLCQKSSERFALCLLVGSLKNRHRMISDMSAEKFQNFYKVDDDKSYLLNQIDRVFSDILIYQLNHAIAHELHDKRYRLDPTGRYLKAYRVYRCAIREVLSVMLYAQKPRGTRPAAVIRPAMRTLRRTLAS